MMIALSGATMSSKNPGNLSMLRSISFVGLVLILFASTVEIQTGHAQTRNQRENFEQRRDPQNRGPFQDRRSGNNNFDYRGGAQTPRELLLLLCRITIGPVKELDTCVVNQNEAWFQRRAFRALHFEVDNNDVFLTSFRLKYLNNEISPIIPVNRRIEKGDRLEVPLPYVLSFISEIQMSIRANDHNRFGPALVKVYGELAGGSVLPGRDEWVRIDCEPVYVLRPNYLSIPVKRREGPFMMIKLQAMIDDIEVSDLKIVYSTGSSEEPWFERYTYIREGQYSQDVHLRGAQRFIDRVEFLSRSPILPVDIVLGVKPRRPHVCLWGLQHLPEDILREPPGPAASTNPAAASSTPATQKP